MLRSPSFRLTAILIAVSLLSLPVMAQTTTGTPAPQIDSVKAAEIRDLQKLIGAGDLGKQVIDAMITQMKASSPNVPEEFWQRFSAKIDPSDLENMVLPVYDKYLTLDDIRQLKAFYNSPTGKKMIAVLPNIMRESMEAGRMFGEKVGRQIMQELEMLEQDTSAATSH